MMLEESCRLIGVHGLHTGKAGRDRLGDGES